MFNNEYQGDETLLWQLARVLYGSRSWHYDLQREFDFHPTVLAAFKIAPCCNYHRLVLEWPHQSMDDKKMLAYVRTEDKAEASKNTKTTVGKYIKRHFPTLPDHTLRDLVYRHSASGCRIVTTTQEMVDAVTNGPRSCMQWSNSDVESLGDGNHPYECYAPEYGWSMAIRVSEEGSIEARALINDGEWVRCYGSNYSSDGELREWLKNEGYEKVSEWASGTKLERLGANNSSGVLFPYIDGDSQEVDLYEEFLEIVSDGEYKCDRTDGTCEGCSRGDPCPDCGGDTDEDDQWYINDSNWVCSHCRNNNYTHIADGDYYIPDRDAVWIDGEAYDGDDLPDYIITLQNGDYCHVDNAVQCVESDEWYEVGDTNMVVLANGDYCHMDYAWQCAATGKLYGNSDDECRVEIDGETYHRDDAPEEEDEDGYDRPDGSISNEAQTVLDLCAPHKWQHVIDAYLQGRAIQTKWEYESPVGWVDTLQSPIGIDNPHLEWRIKPRWHHVVDAQDAGLAVQYRYLDGVVWFDAITRIDPDREDLEFRVRPTEVEAQGETA